ncbi:MAG: dephospho-CoA kinase [Planctomycetes bacterium]|nr:dephospho-CoA kinase [Planctomycetota bacterium]
MSERKKIIGILGGVGSGKSTVAAEFGKLGCAVIDADRIGHELLLREDVRERVVGAFGDGIIGPSGQVERVALGRVVFGNREKLKELTDIMHPLILSRAEELIEEYDRDDGVLAIILDFPLLVEVGWDKRCDKLVFVDCDGAKRDQRVQKRGQIDGKVCKNDGIFGRTENNLVKKRENFQIFLDKKASLAEYVIDNNSDFSAVVEQVKRVFTKFIDRQ